MIGSLSTFTTLSHIYWIDAAAAYEAKLKGLSPTETVEVTKVVEEPNDQIPPVDAFGVDHFVAPTSVRGDEPPQQAVGASSLLAG